MAADRCPRSRAVLLPESATVSCSGSSRRRRSSACQCPLDVLVEDPEELFRIIPCSLKGPHDDLDILLRHRLLPQPGGFQGWVLVNEHVATPGHSVAEGPKMK